MEKDYKVGDLIFCEYAKGEKARGRIISIDNKKISVEIAIAGRRSKTIDKDIIEVGRDKITRFAFAI